MSKHVSQGQLVGRVKSLEVLLQVVDARQQKLELLLQGLQTTTKVGKLCQLLDGALHLLDTTLQWMSYCKPAVMFKNVSH